MPRRDADDDRRDDFDDDERPRRRRRSSADDDEERPRRRRSRKEEAGNKTLLIVLIVGGAVLLVGGGILAIVLSGGGGGSKDGKVAKEGSKKDRDATDEGRSDKESPRDFADKSGVDKGLPRDASDKGRFDKGFPTDKGGPVAIGDAALLLGGWNAFDGEALGMKLAARDVNMRYEFAPDKVTFITGGHTGSGTYSLDPSASPKTINLTATNELGTFNMLGIYKLEGDTLTICMGRDHRPATFSSAGIPFGTMYVMRRGGK